MNSIPFPGSFIDGQNKRIEELEKENEFLREQIELLRSEVEHQKQQITEARVVRSYKGS